MDKYFDLLLLIFNLYFKCLSASPLHISVYYFLAFNTNTTFFCYFLKGDIDDCIITPTVQGQFTPLPEALCDVIMDLTSQGHSATIENMRVNLSIRFV